MELGEFGTVMQTLDNCREFSQIPVECLDEKGKKSPIAFIKYFSKVSRQMKENAGLLTIQSARTILIIV